ncbi:MAG: NADP-dependent oxidoreductase [Pseudomonadota bacterium]
MPQNRRFLLQRRPDGAPVAEDFELVASGTPALAEGQLLIRNHYASLDPAMRGWMDESGNYMPPIPLGDPVRATTIGIVERSMTESFAPGQWVMGLNALEDYSVAVAGGFTQAIDPNLVPNVTNYLSLFGAVGMTAYFGFLDVCEPKEGDTVLVSGAAGAVGSLVGQLAKIHGCRAIGIAGGQEKCEKLTQKYGFDAAIDYKDSNLSSLASAIADVAPDGVDVIFENVGGAILDAGLMNLNTHARVGLCGLISEYNTERQGARNLWQLIVTRSQLRGLLVSDYIDRFGEGAARMGEWAAAGKLVVEEHIDEGLENAFDSFMRLFAGTNQGKMILKLS